LSNTGRLLRLVVSHSEGTRRISPQSIADYPTFTTWQGPSANLSEIQMFERFYAARSLTSQGMDTFVDALLNDPEKGSTTKVDICGTMGSEITAVFCETGDPSPSLPKSIATIRNSENARAIVLVPSIADSRSIQQVLPSAPGDGRIVVETLGWLDDHFDTSLQQTLRLIEVLGNETRMRMLMPLLRKAGAKREYRAKINPKLVYQNLSVLLEAGLVDEFSEGAYELSELGKSVVAEFITFLDKTRRTLDSIQERRG